LVETLIDFIKKICTFISVSSIWILVLLMAFCLVPRHLGILFRLMAALCLQNEELNAGFQRVSEPIAFVDFFVDDNDARPLISLTLPAAC